MFHDLMLTLGAIATVTVIGWLSPGPNMLSVISASLSRGRHTGFATAFGLSMGGLLWATVMVLGAATLFELFPRAVFSLRMIGASYLIWLGVKSLRAAAKGRDTSLDLSVVNHSDWVAFRTGFFVMVTNPKAAIFYSTIFAAFIPVNAPVVVLVIVVLASASQSFLQHCVTAIVFSSSTVMDKYRAASAKITGIIGALYCGLGVLVAADAVRRL